MAGEKVDPLAGLDADLGGGGSGDSTGGYVNQVYFGSAPSKTIAMKRSGQTITVPAGDKTLSVQDAKALYLTDQATRDSWNALLKKNGISVDPIKARALWDTSVSGASDWYSTSQGTQKVTPQQYLTWYLGGQKSGTAANVPSRSIYQYTPEQLGAKIDDVAQNILGRAITDADKTASWYQSLNKTLNDMVMQGTVTTTKQIKNAKTGQMENVTIQKPEVSTEGITQKITGALEAADPESLARKQRIDFTKWLYGQMGFSG